MLLNVVFCWVINSSHVWKDVWHVLLFEMHVISNSNSAFTTDQRAVLH